MNSRELLRLEHICTQTIQLAGGEEQESGLMSALGQKQTFAAHKLMSAKCQEQTSLFDHIIGTGEDRRRYG